MKRKFYCILLILSLIFFTTKIYAQSDDENGFIPSALPQYHSPQIAAMLRFDATPVDLFAGRVDITIPLVDFKDKDFNIPISVKYSSGGFKPSESDNFVGNNWTLMPMFAIYREVKGMPDEMDEMAHLINSSGSTETMKGFLNVRNMSIDANEYKENLWRFPDWYAPLWVTGNARINTGGYDNLIEGEDIQYSNPLISKVHRKGTEVSSDIYKFSCGKYSGRFTIDFDGTVKAMSTSGGDVKIDISRYDMIINSKNPPETNNNQISIKTDDGYTYIFGGSYDAMEYMAVQWSDTENPRSDYKSLFLMGDKGIASPVVSAYYLTKIIAPNGRTLTIGYDNRVTTGYHKDPSLATDLKKDNDLKRAYQLNASLVNHPRIARYVRQGKVSALSVDNAKKSFSITKMAIMKSIKVDNKQIVFNYKNKEKNILEIIKPSYAKTYDFNTTPLQLESVVYTQGVREIDKAELTYTDNGRLFLSSVKNNSGEYKLEYKSKVAVSPFTANFDHWGYTTGSTDNTGLSPLYEYDPYIGGWSNVDESAKRAPALTNWDINMLNEVIYPTGGSIKLEYEQHRYKKSIERLPKSYYQSTLDVHSKDKQGGGVRIKNIKYYDSDNKLLKTKHFLYQNAINDSNSSGTLLYKPVYAGMVQYYRPNIESLVSYTSSLGFNPRNKEQTHIGYSSVIELYASDLNRDYLEMIKGTGYKQTTFTEKQVGVAVPTVSNNYLFYHRYNVLKSAGERAYDDNFGKNCFNEEFDFSQELGLVAKESFYNDQNKLTKQISYHYSRFPENINTSYTLYVNNPKWEYQMIQSVYAQMYKLHYYKYRPVKKEIIDYLDTGNIKQSEQYGYTDDGIYLIYQNIVDSKGNGNQKKYEYGFRSKPAPYIPSSITKESVIYNNKHKYSKYYNYRISDNRLSQEEYPLNSQQVLSDERISYGKDSLISKSDIEMQYLDYDKYGNPVCAVGKDGIPVVYLWSYYGHYPIAKIERIMYNQIQAYNIDANVLAGRSIPSSLEYDAINNLINIFPDIHITTYTYKPSVGMLTSTDPRGVTTYYEYDDFGRLKRIYIKENGVEKNLEAYEYHYQNQ